LASKGKSRFDYTREELYQQIWDFVAENKENYESQFRKLGASLDWSQYVYTLDKKIVDRAYKTFKKMWDDKLIYRGERLVNFCTHHGTGFADIEVSYKNEDSHLWHIRYPLTDQSGELVVATTRPETMFGDTAVAVNPKDKRYTKFVGKTIKLPLTNREIPIIADEMVDTEFGTGAVKITPAHDQNDFEVANRHDLPMITVIDFEGNMNHEAPEAFINLPVDEAREATVLELKKQGYLAKEEPYQHSVGHCYKCGTVIQPLLRDQWFIDVKPLAKKAIKVLKTDKIKFYPDNKKDQLILYLEGIRDWNISRQIAWGIPIPAFQNTDEPDDWIFDDRVDQETIKIGNKTYRRDPDVFDTWFSSSSWPYATLGYPDEDYFKQFYPLSLMETAADILYPWVSRMIMLGIYVTGEVPFKEVYLHGLIQDEHGAKMSKSKGNTVDPQIKVDQYGSDAFRMGIIADEAAGNNRPYDESKIIGARNFCNKLWNIARFTEDKVDDSSNDSSGPKPSTIADHWMLSKLQHSTEVISKDLENHRYASAYDNLYHLVWDDFADWYIEASKSAPNVPLLKECLFTILKLAHPFAPFLTESIWQNFHKNQDSILAIESWPTALTADKNSSKQFSDVQNLVVEIRQLKSALKLKKPTLFHQVDNFIANNTDLISQLAGLKSIEAVKEGSGLKIVNPNHDAWLDVSDEKLDAFVNELEDKISEAKDRIKALQKRLSNKSYVNNAPKHVVNQTKDELKLTETSLDKLQSELDKLK
jgi:valyl-tRNA synthetase